MSADQPLTGDELATIKARAEAATRDRDTAHLKQPWTTLRLVAEIERLQAQVAELGESWRAEHIGGTHSPECPVREWVYLSGDDTLERRLVTPWEPVE